MKTTRLTTILLCLALVFGAIFALASCVTTPAVNVSSSTLYVKKVENLPEDFVMGMDSSQVLALEKSGVKYYNFDGKERDVFQILAENGINTVRVRVWNDPFDKDGNGYGGGNCTVDTALEIGKRAAKYGMSLMVDFHYSDFWADPSKQQTPKAWANMKIDEKAAALHDYTATSLAKLKEAKIKVNIVQIGNETNGALCGETRWNAIAKLMNAGSRAVRETLPETQVAVHFANPEKVKNYREYASKLKDFYVDYDIFASSYYPYWHGTLDNLSSILGEIAETYDKKVMVAETSYAFTAEDADFSSNTIGEGGGVTKDYPFTVQGQANSVRNVINTVANTKNGMGVCYWEGTWIGVGGATWEENSALWERDGSGWASSYAAEYDPDDAGKYYGGCAVDNQAFFDNDGKVLESIKVWALVRKGNEITAKPDAMQDAACSFIIGEEIKLPETVNAVMTDDSKQPVAATWNVTAAKLTEISNSEAGQYTVEGTADGKAVKCVITMRENNLLYNGGFEDDENESTEPNHWTVTGAVKSDTAKVLVTSENPWEGSNAFHWWLSKGNADFSLEQEATISNAGTYKVSVRVMGSADKDQNITFYVKVNGQIVKQEKIVKDGFQSDPNLWQAANIEFDVTQQTVVTVGISVKCADGGTWGDIDNFVLSKVEQE